MPPQSVAVAYRREIFNVVGTFDETFDACEDVEFNHRLAQAGMRCFFTPRIQVRYFPRLSLSGLFRQMMGYGRGRVRLRENIPVPSHRWHSARVVPRRCAPRSATRPSVAVPAAGLCHRPRPLWSDRVRFACAVALLRERQPELIPLLAAVYPAIHFGAAVGVWWEVFRPASGTWPQASSTTAGLRWPLNLLHH